MYNDVLILRRNRRVLGGIFFLGGFISTEYMHAYIYAYVYAHVYDCIFSCVCMYILG